MNKFTVALAILATAMCGPALAGEGHGAAVSAEAESNSAAVSGSVSTAISEGGHAAAQSGAATSGNAQSITFNSPAIPTTQTLKTAPSVYAPALTTTLTETCMGSTSVGGSGIGFGISVGSTWNDGQCVRRLNAREMAQTLGDRDAARALMCQDDDVAAAYAAVGQSCTEAPQVAVLGLPPAPVVAAAPPPTGVMAPIPNPMEQPPKAPRF